MVTISGSASFASCKNCDNQKPPKCTTVNSGSMSLKMGNSVFCSASGNGSASCSVLRNTALMANGTYKLTASASDCKGSAQNTGQLVVDNTPVLSVATPAAGTVGVSQYIGLFLR